MWQIMAAVATVVSVRWGPCTVVSALAGLRSYHADHAEVLREARAKNLSRSTDSGAKAPPQRSSAPEAVPGKRLWQEFRGQDEHNHVFIMAATLISVVLNLIGFLTPNYTGKILDVLTTSDASTFTRTSPSTAGRRLPRKQHHLLCP